MSRGGKSGRRSFLRRAGLFTGFLGLGSVLKLNTQFFLIGRAPTQADQARGEWSGSEVRSFRRLGRTGWRMSDISFGSAKVNDADVVRAALDRGVNYIDTSPDYSDGRSERVVGEAVKGRRPKVFIASKFCRPEGHLDIETPVAEIIAAVDGALGRLGTDYVDLLHIHACNSIERLMAPNFHEAFDHLKEQGKARFMGVSSHTPLLEEVTAHAVDSGRFDVVMAAYSFKAWPKLGAIIERAHAKDVGFVAMKTLKGAYHTVLKDFSADERNSFTQAAFKWVNSNPHLSGLVVTIDNMAKIDEYLFASGKKLDSDDIGLLERYDRLVANIYCRPGCGACLSACPAGVPVDDILRYSMYFENYGAEKKAMAGYNRLARAGATAEACRSCAAPCEASCPFELPIRQRLGKAHGQLALPG